MKILGLSCGTRNGNNDTMCRVALEAAKEMGAEIEFIHVFDWDIKYCTGCVACSRSLVMGKGMVCSQKDDFAKLFDKMAEADGVLVVDPIYESGGSGLFHVLCDRMGPGHDIGMMYMLDGKLKEQGKEGLDPKYLKKKAISFVGIGGSDWACRVETDHAMLAMSPAWTVVNNEFFSWSKDVIMQDEKVERMRQIGRNLVEAAKDVDNAKWMGEPGACPHCNGNNFYIFPGTTHCVCELCGLEGTLEVVDGAFKFKFAPEDEHKAHDTISGKKLHGDDIFENEGRLMNLFKDPEFKARKEHFTSVCEPTPSPSKAV
ncbi:MULTISPECIES: flavodoxin family protein [Pseudobutyrivibrio]|uniref:NADPH-dependent FMN reductase n=2 Tax=Pseudobutyrivibrio ruminis TaxID=46206 RepID=A0A1H7K9W5_9FIRM|nr:MULTISPECIES: flavodoxin family protein [Pseudobutyrivibrio]SEK83628.1 NADPH-dependent FMN reductase [Pseudobutyrivibrio ruminis]SET13302.1 NADPH-dependent FMN reductase [Pseudobutyrivibrio sp. C4]SFO38542.1 NADPH-dependent FMN reductase [Pseudobutyrivibrio sp. JW11]SOB98478.1 NADPH-dependent FMN reductase [Pseudobutyrivibrio ruminis DSM 9787]